MKTLPYILLFCSISLFAQNSVPTIELPYTRNNDIQNIVNDSWELQNGITPLTSEVILSICNPEFDERLYGNDEYYLIGTGSINSDVIFYIYFHYEIFPETGESGGYKLSIIDNGSLTIYDWLLSSGYKGSVEHNEGISTESLLTMEENIFSVVETRYEPTYDSDGNFDSKKTTIYKFTYLDHKLAIIDN